MIVKMVVCWSIWYRQTYQLEGKCCQKAFTVVMIKNMKWLNFKLLSISGISFEEFMVSLIQASSNYSTFARFRTRLLDLIGRYQDCIMACEHQFSKRVSGQITQDVLASEHFQDACKIKRRVYFILRGKDNL